MNAMRKTVTVAGGPVNVVLTPAEHGYLCEYDRQRNYTDNPRYLDTLGEGETVAEAMSDYIRSCYVQERQDFERSMQDASYRSR